jgi:small subunit ribosomal protein S14
VAKMALIERELKRDKLVAKYAKKYAEFKAIAGDAKRTDEERAAARLGCKSCPATQIRHVSVIVALSPGAPVERLQHFGLARAKIREMAFAGEIPGIVKASW